MNKLSSEVQDADWTAGQHLLQCARWVQYDGNHKRYTPQLVCTCGADNKTINFPSPSVSEAAPERIYVQLFPHLSAEGLRVAAYESDPREVHDNGKPVYVYARVHQPPEQNLEDKNSGGRCTCGHRCPSKQEWMDGAQCVHAEDCELMQTKASSRSTDRIPKDISLTLAEIQQKQDGRRAETRADAEYIADIDTLLSIIDTLQRAIPLAAFEFHKIDGRIAESISQCAASNMKAELIKRVREEMSGFTPESIERFAAKLEAVELTQDTESSKASHNPEVSVESSVQHQTESSSESTLVTAPDVQAADVPVQPPNALKELLNRYTVPCPNDCEHSQCPLLRELQAIAENSRIVDVLAKAQETVKPIVDAEKESENIGELMNVRLRQPSPVQPEEWVTCADCGQKRPMSSLESRNTFVCRYCLSTKAVQVDEVSKEQDNAKS